VWQLMRATGGRHGRVLGVRYRLLLAAAESTQCVPHAVAASRLPIGGPERTAHTAAACGEHFGRPARQEARSSRCRELKALQHEPRWLQRKAAQCDKKAIQQPIPVYGMGSAHAPSPLLHEPATLVTGG
jgi:hypothetical protein